MTALALETPRQREAPRACALAYMARARATSSKPSWHLSRMPGRLSVLLPAESLGRDRVIQNLKASCCRNKVNALIISYLSIFTLTFPLDKPFKGFDCVGRSPRKRGVVRLAPTAPLFLVIWCGTTIFFHPIKCRYYG